MKAEALKDRPDYGLYKQNDIVSFFNLQLPRWLVEDSRYIRLSVESKFIYTLLFNRFQLSKHNGWINENGEVFVIYTRKELAERANISEKRISAAMNELREYELIWERRCGRGFANQIYLASVKLSLEDSLKSKGGPLDPVEYTERTDTYSGETDNTIDDVKTDKNVSLKAGTDEQPANLRTDKTALLDTKALGVKEKLSTDIVDNPVDISAEAVNNSKGTQAFRNFLAKNAQTAALEPPDQQFKNIRNGSSKTAEPTVQEPPNQPPSYLDLSKKDFSNYYISQSESSPNCSDAETAGRTDAEIIKALVEQSELQALEKAEAGVMKNAIERLYYMKSICVGGAVYPNESIRANLRRLNFFVVQDTIFRLNKNSAKIRNSSAYVVTVLFNTIMESGSDLIVDPYLNSLKGWVKTGYNCNLGVG